MGLFDRLDQAASRTCDIVNEIPFTMTPMKSTPNGEPSVDAGRHTIDGHGIFDYVDNQYGIELGVRKSYREANDLRALQSGREPRLSVDRRRFPSLMDEARQGDVIEFPSRPDLPRFEVVSVMRDGLSRMSIKLVHLGRQS